MANQGLRRVSVSSVFPYGKQVVGKIASSTGIYGRKISGKASITAVKVRGKGRR